jgi:predicted ATP-binding protein involved in virulence
MARYDIRASSGFDEVASVDLARETKQSLSYAAIVGALAGPTPHDQARRLAALSMSMTTAVNELVALAGFEHIGLDPVSLEPRFQTERGSVVAFDSLPAGARHLVAYAALPVRAHWAACPSRDPRESEGIVLIDEVDLHQDVSVKARLIAGLQRALPSVQWIVTTACHVVASSCEADAIVALRKAEAGRVEVFTDSAARTH